MTAVTMDQALFKCFTKEKFLPENLADQFRRCNSTATALLIPPKGLQKAKKLSNKNISYHSLQHLVQVTLIYLALLNPWLIVCSFHNIKLIQSKHQSLNSKKHLTKAKYREFLSGTFNCNDKRCKCCNYLLINDHYMFKNIQTTFKWKNSFTCNGFNLRTIKTDLVTCSLIKPFSDHFP